MRISPKLFLMFSQNFRPWKSVNVTAQSVNGLRTTKKQSRDIVTYPIFSVFSPLTRLTKVTPKYTRQQKEQLREELKTAVAQRVGREPGQFASTPVLRMGKTPLTTLNIFLKNVPQITFLIFIRHSRLTVTSAA